MREYTYIGDFRNEAHYIDTCPDCENDEDLEYLRETEEWHCHYCETTWLGPPPPPEPFHLPQEI